MNPQLNSNIPFKNELLKKTINWSALLDGTQKTLNIINQAIPVFYQVKPIVSNCKTLFKVANIINEPDTKEEETVVKNSSNYKGSPIFYI